MYTKIESATAQTIFIKLLWQKPLHSKQIIPINALPQMHEAIGFNSNVLQSKNGFEKSICIMQFTNSAITVVIAAPIIPIVGIKMKFNPTFTIAETTVALRQSFS
ncbi:MAG: hypothetical protein EGP69_00940 [[Ruminococcus] faecis]|nr:hypothetical protein [Mediterraneibacter faecis]